LSFAEIFVVRKLESLLMMRHPLHDPTFSHFSRTPTCDRQTDMQTHDDHICVYRAIYSIALRGKNGTLCYDSTLISPNITFHYHSGPFTFEGPLVGGFGGGLRRLCAPS